MSAVVEYQKAVVAVMGRVEVILRRMKEDHRRIYSRI